MLEPKTSSIGRAMPLSTAPQSDGDITRFCKRLDDLRDRARSIAGAAHGHANRIIHDATGTDGTCRDEAYAPLTLDGVDARIDALNVELDELAQATARFARL